MTYALVIHIFLGAQPTYWPHYVQIFKTEAACERALPAKVAQVKRQHKVAQFGCIRLEGK